ncbi:hypothetical protein EJ02DRAFT_446989 [Clathrospora elynae]|uniref:Uncharacterized protein n=1 Tax=Clathrospora elynae TaxID=706981 RepID=A0A6A5SLH5_9PLEO|nr:hypothetical protein EJ02DRAFT_446989 [Clathrospora elynae]
MFSLPMIAPRPDASLWPSHRSTHTAFEDTTSHSPPNAPSHSHQRRPPSHHGAHHAHAHARASTAFLTTLTNDENTIEQRKLNVRRFGAGWLRPPGVAKTLQAIKDEELEKEEQELMQRREQVMLDLAAAQQDAVNEEQREQGERMQEDVPEERDLDDEVPEAEDSESASEDASASDSEGEEGESASEEGQESTVPFNEDSFIEGSMLEAEVSHMLEMEEAEMAGVLQDERDLDDDVPEAGSYEHTDSELEDSSDIDNSMLPPGMGSVRLRRSARRSSGRRASGRMSSGLPSGMAVGGLLPAAGRVSFGIDLGQGRSSFGMDGSSSILEGSSFLRSSPAGAAAATRGSLRDRFLGAARGGGRRA